MNNQGILSTSVYDKVWQEITNGNESSIIPINQISVVIELIEDTLGIPNKFLGGDLIVKEQLDQLITYFESLISHTEIRISKQNMIDIISELFKDIKLIDLTTKEIYGNFNDDHDAYEDNEHNLIYKQYEDEYDYDDTESLMEIKSTKTTKSAESASSLITIEDMEVVGEVISKKSMFNLNEILEEIDNKHTIVETNFKIIDYKIQNLRIMNLTDLKELNRLINKDNIMNCKLKSIRNDIEILNEEFQDLKVKQESTASLKPQMINLIESELSPKDRSIMKRLSRKDEQISKHHLSSLSIIFFVSVMILMVSYIYSVE